MNMELNKIFAAVLVAGVIAYFSGILSHAFVPATEAKEGAGYAIAAETSTNTGATAGASVGPEPIKDLLASADAAVGEKAAKVCAACHTFDKGGANRIGPHLFGVFGRDKGSVADFAYSDAMKAKGGKWDEDSLNQFLWNPKKFIEGSKMSFAGIKKPEDRAAVIKWLETLK